MSLVCELWDVTGFATGHDVTFVDTISNVVAGGFQDLLGEPGGGTLTIPLDDPHVTTIFGNKQMAIRFTTPGGLGNRSFEWFIEDAEFVFAATKSEDRLLKLSGRGMLSYLERAVIYPSGWPTTKSTEYLSPSQTYAQTLLDLFGAARGRGAIPSLVSNFDGSTDSTQPRPPGSAWTTGNHAIRWRVGENLLDSTLRVGALGNENYCFLNNGGTLATGTGSHDYVQLDLYTNQRGTDRSGSVIFQLPGDFGYGLDGDQENLSLHRNVSQMRSTILVEGGSGTLQERADSGLISAWGRRETYLSFPMAGTDTAEATNAADKAMGLLGVEVDPIAATLLSGPGHYNPYVDYFPGDYVGINAPPWYVNAKHRIVGLTVTQLLSGQLSVTAHFNALKLEQRLKLQKQLAY